MNRKLSEWWLFIHSIDQQISSYDWNSINLKANHHYEITYTEMSYELLPSPYATNCIDYRLKMGAKSRADCIRKCKIKNSFEKCDVISHEIDVYSGEQNVIFAQTDEEFNCTKLLYLDEQCLNDCANYDCFKQYMEMKIIEEKNTSGKYDHVNLVSIWLPFKPKSTFIHRPSIETVEFLCYLASTLSLWFGFSVISVNSLLISLLKSKLQANSNFMNLIFNNVYFYHGKNRNHCRVSSIKIMHI